MTAYDMNIELPPLPEPAWVDGEPYWYDRHMEAYARAAIEADRKRRGEPVAWRVHPFDYGVGYEGVYALTSRPDQVAAWERKGWEVQPLFTAPQPAEPVKVPSDDEILHLADIFLYSAGKNYGIIQFARALLARYGKGTP